MTHVNVFINSSIVHHSISVTYFRRLPFLFSISRVFSKKRGNSEIMNTGDKNTIQDWGYTVNETVSSIIIKQSGINTNTHTTQIDICTLMGSPAERKRKYTLTT